MKFSNGYWLPRTGWRIEHPRAIQGFEVSGGGRLLRAFVYTRHIPFKGAELDSPQLTVDLEAVAEGIIRVRLTHFAGAVDPGPHYQLQELLPAANTKIETGENRAKMLSGELSAEISCENGNYLLEFKAKGKQVTSAIGRSQGIAESPSGETYIHEQLTVQPNEYIYGLGERFSQVIKNGQTVDMWNADGGTATEQAYKNIPFYLSNRGYGVFVNHPEKVSYEVTSEINTRVQFSVPGQYLEYYVIYGGSPKKTLERYTALTGRPPHVPDWSYGLWLSTSFKTDYTKVESFVDKMEELGIPLSVIHFDCYWMRASHWCDFTWDPEVFPNPEALLERLHKRGIKTCVWINPYIAQRSALFEEGRQAGYLLHSIDGSVRQSDHWQSGLSFVDFTNPAAVEWWKGKLRTLIRQGVDALKTDFGERIPTDNVRWHDGSDPQRMHNYYSYLYNKAAYEVIAEERGEEEAIVFARSATAGSQVFPVHWGGDSEPSFVSMGETLRGGLSFGLSGFGYWSHDMGGFEGQSPTEVFTRWYPFGMLSSHSRLHGSDSYRVPWNYGDDAVRVAQRFTRLKNRLVPYLKHTEEDAVERGIPILRHMILEYPDDLGACFAETQYMLGEKLLVAPVMSDSGEVDFYLPCGGWINILNGKRVRDAGWHRETHAIDSLPVMVREGTVLALSAECMQTTANCGPSGVVLYVYGKPVIAETISVRTPDGLAEFTVTPEAAGVSVQHAGAALPWAANFVGERIQVESGSAENSWKPFPELASGEIVAPSQAENGNIRAWWR
ncbi:alpha-xylosidase [Actinobaculum suis]|uniref:alpha-D-xyloside xylohydrolase n=1 Tax=Actinobaculum suis TaxID=1657 RepID=A0AAW9HM98_9ACTO|nr:alpha-xylosidase [Actinobaculum suis]MDY5152833.1 alpha-xylosidase [Actinobaculum suis]